jgi:trehalose-phosphatase
MERLTSQGLYSAIRVPARSREFVEDAFAWICARGWDRLVERKPFGLALHGRGTRREWFDAVCRSVCRRFASGARRNGLRIVAFDGGLELRPAGRHKGQVVDRVFEELDCDPAVAYLGDDATDEDAFEALRGRGPSVLVRRVPRPTTRADAWLKPPEELRDFLERWHRAVTSRRALRDRFVRRAG